MPDRAPPCHEPSPHCAEERRPHGSVRSGLHAGAGRRRRGRSEPQRRRRPGAQLHQRHRRRPGRAADHSARRPEAHGGAPRSGRRRPQDRRALAKDPVLSAKVLRLANSSFFGGQRSMASIDAAVALIGMQALNRLIVACGVSASFKDVPGIDLARLLARRAGRGDRRQQARPRLEADAEEAYVCGLLHATGHLILCQTYPEIADAMFTGFATCAAPSSPSVESENFGIDHPAVGALWVETIGFPQTVADTIRKSTQPPAATDATRPGAARRLRAGRRRGGRRTRSRPPGRPCRQRCRRASAAPTASPTPPSPSSTKPCRRPSRSSDGASRRRRRACRLRSRRA